MTAIKTSVTYLVYNSNEFLLSNKVSEAKLNEYQRKW